MSWNLCHTTKMWITLLGILTFLLLENSEGAISGYKDTPTQYHIQTDEGSERYFRYQTYNGQYRKERRLDDGTVIGSYGWVDPSGFLRMTDYIADSKGYRVVKELMEYVGTNSILDTTEQNKKAYNQKYTAKKHSTKVSKPFKPFPYSDSLSPSSSEIVVAPVNTLVTPALRLTTPRPQKTISPPVLIVYGPVKNKLRQTLQLPAQSTRFANRRPVSQTGVKNSETEEGPRPGEKDVFKSYATPIRVKNKSSGFIYKIPFQYHKEETGRDGSRQGSFGYVDPYGIRRVIHYDATNGGFKATRDFKFVGRQY